MVSPLKNPPQTNQNPPFFQPSKSTKLLFIQHHKKPITKEVIMQTKVNSVVIHATNATGAGKSSTLKIESSKPSPFTSPALETE
jgi:predicted GTPase